MNMKNVYKFGLCLLGALALNVSAQDFRGKDLNTSFRDKRIDNFQFQKARAIKGVTDFQRSAGDSPDFEGANLAEVSFRNPSDRSLQGINGGMNGFRQFFGFPPRPQERDQQQEDLRQRRGDYNGSQPSAGHCRI